MTEDEIQKMAAIGNARIEATRKLLASNPAAKRAIAVREKQEKILRLSDSISFYAAQIDGRTDIATCSNVEFERHMRSRNRIDRALVKTTAAAVRYNVSALKNLTVNIGSRFLNLPVWGGKDGVPFTLEDENALVLTKTQSADAFISALKNLDRVVYAMECIVSGSYLDGDAVRALQRSSVAILSDFVARALWVDFEVLSPKYVNDRALMLKAEPTPSAFHFTPQEGDNFRVVTMRVNIYINFDQRLYSFAPIPCKVFPIFITSPIPPADVI